MKRRPRVRLLWFVASILLPCGLLAQSPESTDRAAARYRELALRNPAESVVLDRLWKGALERGTTSELLADFAHTPGLNAALVHGHLLKRAGRAADAHAVYKRATAIDPDSPAPFLALAELLTDTDAAAAASAYESALSHLVADDSGRADLLLKLGAAWQLAGENARATAAWEEVAAREPDNLQLRLQLAQAYEKAGDSAKAISAYGFIKECAAASDRLNALREISRLEQARDNFDGARAALEQALALTARGHWMRPELERQLTRLYLRAGRSAEQEQRSVAEAERNPRDVAAVVALANLYDETGEPDKQAVWLEKAVKLAPRDRDLRLRLARVLAEAGELNRAAEHYDALLREPGRTPPDWILARSDLDLQLGRFPEAVARINKLLSTAGSDDSIRAAGLAFFQHNRFDGETEALLKAECDRTRGGDEASLGLVEFYFGQKKNVPACEVLDRWSAPRPGEPPVERAARLDRAADVLKLHGSMPDAVARLREAVAIDSDSGAGRRVALADALIGAGETEPARMELEAAYTSAKTDAERNEVDDKLFMILQTAAAARAPSTLSGGRALVPARDNPLVHEFLRDLEFAARESGGNPEPGLRLARFYARGGAPADAIEAALRVVRAKPDFLPARELLVRLATETARRELLVDQLQALAKLDPAGRSYHLRRLAYARLEEGEVPAAIALFREIESLKPGSAEAIADLATALQRAERWNEAVVAWERVYALPGSARTRGDMRQPFLIALEKTGAPRRAAEILATAADEETDQVRRLDMFRELVTYTQRWNLMGWLEARGESRLRAAPLDYFALLSLAELRRAQGRDADAYELLTRAYYGAPDPAAALQNLVRTADDLGDAKGALQHQRRLLHVPGQLTAENLERLANLEESDLDFDGAARTWGQIVNRFPRDPGVMARAAEYFRKNDWPTLEREVLERLVVLDPADLARQARLAQIYVEDGALDSARSVFEGILARTEPEPAGAALRIPETESEPTRVPVRSRLPRARGAIVTAGAAPSVPATSAMSASDGDLRWRFEAIKQFSRLVASGGARDGTLAKSWLERWRRDAAQQPGEALAAFVHAGRTDLALDLLVERMRNPDVADDAARAFVRVALQASQFDRLGKWVWAEAENVSRRRDQMLDGLEAFLLARGGRTTPAGLIDALFPPQFRSRFALWGDAVARIFVAQHRYAEAAVLGARFLADIRTNRTGYGVEIARWQLFLGDEDKARSILRFALEGTNGGDSLDAPYFEALRMMHEFLPAAERKAWVQSQCKSAEAGGQAQAALVTAFLEGLGGRLESARRALERWVELRPPLNRDAELAAANGFLGSETSTAARYWAAVLANGTRLEACNLRDLARHLWKLALADPVIAELQDARAREVVREIRQRLRLNEWTTEPPGEAELLVAEFLSTKPPLDEVTNLATGLAARHYHRLALRLREHALALEPGSGEHWRAMLGALRAGDDNVALRDALERQLAWVAPGSSGMGRREWIVQLVDLDEKAGNIRAARDVLETHIKLAPRDNFLRVRLAQLLDRKGFVEEAAELYREVLRVEPDYPIAVQALSQIEEKRGNVAEALALLETMQSRPTANPGDIAARIVAILTRANQIPRARTVALSMVRAGHYAHLPRVAEAFADKGERSFAADLLRLGIQKCREPQLRFNLAQTLLENHLTPAADGAAFERELRRLRQIGVGEPRLQFAFQNVRLALARKHKTEVALEKILRAEWRGGAGDAMAGQKLMLLLAGTKRDDDLRVLTREFLARPDAVDASPEAGGQLLFQLADSLQRAECPEIVADLMVPLIQRFPESSTFALTRAAALQRAGRRTEAEQIFRRLEPTWLTRPEVVGQIAASWQDLGETTRAAEVYERAIERDTNVESVQNHLALARLKLTAGDVAAARKLVKAAYRNPSARDLTPLLDVLAASDEDAIEQPAWRIAGDFLLRPELRRQLPAALCLRLFQMGRIEAARRVARAHPTMLIESPEVAARLRETAEPADFAAVGQIFQLAWQRPFSRGERFQRETAIVHTKWAEAELLVGHGDAALGHLLQARNYCRADFPSAKKLTEMRLERGERVQARAVLNDYIACRDAPDAGRDKARAMLATL